MHQHLTSFELPDYASAASWQSNTKCLEIHSIPTPSWTLLSLRRLSCEANVPWKPGCAINCTRIPHRRVPKRRARLQERCIIHKKPTEKRGFF